jgi:hypothetical protein
MLESEDMLTTHIVAEKRTSSLPSFSPKVPLANPRTQSNRSYPIRFTALEPFSQSPQKDVQQAPVVRPQESEAQMYACISLIFNHLNRCHHTKRGLCGAYQDTPLPFSILAKKSAADPLPLSQT